MLTILFESIIFGLGALIAIWYLSSIGIGDSIPIPISYAMEMRKWEEFLTNSFLFLTSV